MPPRPFPFALRVGTDICSVARIQRLLAPESRGTSPPLDRFLAKLLTWPERHYFWLRFRDAENAFKDLNAVSQFLAGRWAAKEACRKACEHMGSSNGFHSIMILPPNFSKLSLHGAASTPDLHQRLLDTTRAVITPEPFVDNLIGSPAQNDTLRRVESNNSSIMSLPLQGATLSPEIKETTTAGSVERSPSPSPSPSPSAPSQQRRAMSKMELAKAKFEGLAGPSWGSGEEDKRCRKRSWSFKARLSARHGIKEII